MIAAPKIAAAVNIPAHLSFELLLASLVVICAGVAMLIGGGLLKYQASLYKESEGSAEPNLNDGGLS